MAAEVKSASEYYEYLNVVQKLCGKLISIQKNNTRIIYDNFNIEVCKKKLDKEIKMIDQLISQQESDLC
jgi:hypothetical protein